MSESLMARIARLRAENANLLQQIADLESEKEQLLDMLAESASLFDAQSVAFGQKTAELELALAEAKAQVPVKRGRGRPRKEKQPSITVNGLYRGQTVRFVYTNASKVVKKREVLITSVGEQSFRGQDIDKAEYRTFRFNRVHNGEFVDVATGEMIYVD